MTVEHVEIFVEEPSMKAALQVLVPSIAPDLSFDVFAYQGKADLLSKLPNRLRGYSSFLPPGWRILVVVDRDDDDCTELKQRLEGMATQSGLATKSAPRRQRWSVVNRIAIEELEAWFFGDWQAVCQAYPRVDESVPLKARYRHPDDIRGGTWQTFERFLQDAGYMPGGLTKIEAARSVSEKMDPARNSSPSFCAFRDAIIEFGA
jgi:hypothetical protein